MKLPARCLFFNADQETCVHNNLQKKNNKHHKHQGVLSSDDRIKKYFENLEEPSKSEGFESVITVVFAPDSFDSKEDEKAYSQNCGKEYGCCFATEPAKSISKTPKDKKV